MDDHQSVYASELEGWCVALPLLVTQSTDHPLVTLAFLDNTHSFTRTITHPCPASTSASQLASVLHALTKTMVMSLSCLPHILGSREDKAAEVEAKEAVRKEEAAAVKRGQEDHGADASSGGFLMSFLLATAELPVGQAKKGWVGGGKAARLPSC